ncbi:MAG: ATP-binding protein [Hyphomicrobiaceae bacterium]
MQRTRSHRDDTRRDLLALLVAALACATVLTLTVLDQRGQQAWTLAPIYALTLAIVGGLVLGAAALVLYMLYRARAEVRTVRAQAESTRRDLAMAEAVLKTEPQVLVFWEHGQGLKVITHTLKSVPGVPDIQSELLRFGSWLDPRSAGDLKTSLDGLFANGQAFSLLLRTMASGDLEADGRASGSRAILRLRDVSGYRSDLVDVMQVKRKLQTDLTVCQTMLDALPHPVWLYSDTGRLEWANLTYVRAVDARDLQDVIDNQIELLESRQRQALKARPSGPGNVTQRMNLITVGGDRKPHDVMFIQHPRGLAGIAMDVTDLESARGALDEQNSVHDRTLDRVSTAVAIFTPSHSLTFFNEAYAKLWELDPNWLKQAPSLGEVLDRLRELSRLPAMVDYRSWKKQQIDLFKRPEATIEDLWHLPDGRMVQVVAEPRPDGGLTLLYEDRSEQLQLESRYQTLNKVQTETLDALREGVAVFGTDGRLRLFNSALVQIWKLDRGVLAQRPHFDEFVRKCNRLFADEIVWDGIAEAVTSLTGDYRTLADTMHWPDGTYIDYAATPLPDGSTLVTFTDVTASQRYQRALREKNEALEAADRLKSQFVSHVSYELRTPLTDILGFSELLESPHTGPLNELQRDYLGAVTASSRTLRSIIDNILDLTSIDAGAFELSITRVDVRGVIRSAVDGIHDRAQRARTTIDVGIADDVSTCEADEQRIRQVLYNLLSNAIGFSRPAGTVYLSCYLDAGMVVFEVADQGSGIPKDEQAHVFDRFVTIARGSKHRGAGLGLSIAKSLVELHGGTIELTSEIGEGTRVRVAVPRVARQTTLPLGGGRRGGNAHAAEQSSAKLLG